MIEIVFSVSTTWYSMDNATCKHTPVLIICVGTYYRSIRRLQPSCQSFHLDSTPGGQSEWTGLSQNAVTCGASHCQHSCFLQMSVGRNGSQVRSVTPWQHCHLSLRTMNGNPAMTFHKVLQRKSSTSQIFQMKSDSGENSALCVLYIYIYIYIYRERERERAAVHYSLKSSFPKIS